MNNLVFYLPCRFYFSEKFKQPVIINLRPVGRALMINFRDKNYKIYGANNCVIFTNGKSKRYSIYTVPEVINNVCAIEIPVESRDVIVYTELQGEVK